MAAARLCMSRLRAGAGPALSRWGDRSLRAAGRIPRGWTGGAFTAGVVITAARSDPWTAANAPAPADPFVPSDQKYACIFCLTRPLHMYSCIKYLAL